MPRSSACSRRWRGVIALLAFGAGGPRTWASDHELKQAIAAIERDGGVVKQLDSVDSNPPAFGLEVHASDAALRHLKGLTNLQVLDLSNNPISAAGLEHLASRNGLKLLNLTGTRASGAGIDRVLNKFQDMDIVIPQSIASQRERRPVDPLT